MVETDFRVHGRTSTSESQESPAALLKKIFRETQTLGCRLGGLSKNDSILAAGSGAYSSGSASEHPGHSRDRGVEGRQVKRCECLRIHIEAVCRPCSRLSALVGLTNLTGVCQ